MPDLRSALTGRLRPGRFGAGGVPLVLSELPLGTLIQMSGWRETFDDAARPVLAPLGLSGIGGFDRAQESDRALAFRIAPERLLLRFPTAATWSEAEGGIDPALTPFLDLSHSRTLLRVAGIAAPDFMARLMPIDFDADEFGPGRFVQSGIHSTAVLAHRVDASGGASAFDIYVPRSFAASLWDFITEAALPFGFRVDANG